MYMWVELRTFAQESKYVRRYSYLSRKKLALAKQNVPVLIRVIRMPDNLLATGYCIMLQNRSVPGILPSTSVLGLMDVTITFPNDITTCNIHISTYIN